jgi:hypothetical protein
MNMPSVASKGSGGAFHVYGDGYAVTVIYSFSGFNGINPARFLFPPTLTLSCSVLLF